MCSVTRMFSTRLHRDTQPFLDPGGAFIQIRAGHGQVI